MRERLLYLLLMLGLVACGKDEKEAATGGGGTKQTASLPPAPTQGVGGDAAALVPADAQAVVCIRSLDGVVAMTKSFADAIGEKLPFDARNGLAMMTNVAPAIIDGNGQILAAGKMTPGAPMPSMTFVLPVTDVDKAMASGTLPFKAKRGNYVGMSSEEGYAAGGGNKLLTGMPDGDLVVRLDLATLTKLYGQVIEGYLGMGQGLVTGMIGQGVPGVDAASTAARIFGFTRDVVNSAELLDIVGGAKGGMVDVDLAYTAKEGSPLAKAGAASELDSLAKHVPTEFPVTVLVHCDPNTLMDWFNGGTAAAKSSMPPEHAKALGDAMTGLASVMSTLGSDWLFTAKADDDGLRLVIAASADDADDSVAKYMGFFKNPGLAGIGLMLEPGDKRDVAGVSVQRVRLTIDSKKFGAMVGAPAGAVDMAVGLLFGTGGINVDLAAGDGRLVMAIGGDDSLTAAVLGASEPPSALKTARAGARGDLRFLVHADVRNLLKGASALARKAGGQAPEMPDGPPAPVTFYGSREKRIYRFGLHVDAEQLKGVVKAMD